jgi:hypothetical protein
MYDIADGERHYRLCKVRQTVEFDVDLRDVCQCGERVVIVLIRNARDDYDVDDLLVHFLSLVSFSGVSITPFVQDVTVPLNRFRQFSDVGAILVVADQSDLELHV